MRSTSRTLWPQASRSPSLRLIADAVRMGLEDFGPIRRMPRTETRRGPLVEEDESVGDSEQDAANHGLRAVDELVNAQIGARELMLVGEAHRGADRLCAGSSPDPRDAVLRTSSRRADLRAADAAQDALVPAPRMRAVHVLE